MFFSKYDPEFDTHILDDDSEDRVQICCSTPPLTCALQLLDFMEDTLAQGVETETGFVVDFHSPSMFPKRWCVTAESWCMCSSLIPFLGGSEGLIAFVCLHVIRARCLTVSPKEDTRKKKLKRTFKLKYFKYGI